MKAVQVELALVRVQSLRRTLGMLVDALDPTDPLDTPLRRETNTIGDSLVELARELEARRDRRDGDNAA